MELKTSLYNNIYSFSSIKEVLAKANEKKSGDTLAGVGAKSDLERVAAKVVLADLTVKDITENPAIDYDRDSVTRIILDDLDKEIYEQVKGITIGDLREYILDSKRTSGELLTLSKGLSSEVIASVCKLMSNLDLMYV